MPTYGYECLDCANSFETVQRITEDALTKCESCGGVLKKKIFPVGIVFKGSGFYVNDYAKKSGETSAAVKAEAPATDAAPAASTTESSDAQSKPVEAKVAEPASAPVAPAVPAPVKPTT